MSISMLLIYLAVGSVVGLLAGLLGVGGGTVIVPVLVFMFNRQGLPADQIMQLALATSLASIAFTSVSSALSHHRHGAVDWRIVKRMTPGIVLGTFGGSVVVSRVFSSGFLQAFFAVFLLLVSLNMLSGKKPKPSRQLPGPLGLTAVGGGIGVASSMAGIGGGSLTVPFLMWCNVTGHRAVATSAAVGFPLAVAGALGFSLTNLGHPGLPAWSVGFVYLPALLGIVCASVLTAPLGAKLAHSLPVARLKRVFAVFLVLIAVRMAWDLLA